MKELIERVKLVLGNPEKFFSSLKKEQGYKASFRYLAILSIIPAIMSISIGRVWGNYSINAINHFFNLQLPTTNFTFEFFFMNAVLGYFVALGLSFAGAAVLHLWILLFKGKEVYEKTYQLSVYSQTPRLLLGWVPLLGALVWVYDLYLLIVGTEKIHGISQKNALYMYLIPALLLFILALAGIVISVVLFTTLGAGFAQSIVARMGG
ncbi:MAG: YIP1 family protein [Candidatus Woesearchaeota archaeon]